MTTPRLSARLHSRSGTEMMATEDFRKTHVAAAAAAAGDKSSKSPRTKMIMMNSRLRLVACLLVVYISTLTTTTTRWAHCQMGWSAQDPTAGGGGGGHYDPEQQDGIPVLSARTLRPRPADDWLNYDDEQSRQDRMNHLRRMQLQRRQSDGDLEDGVEDDDDDEYKSGSSNHDSTATEPAYGESRRAAQDGDEIERFFDNNIGPEDVGASPSNQHETSSDEVPIHTIPGLRSAPDPDDDMYEAAASSPLVTLFQSLLGVGHGAQRRPFVIHATTTSSSSGTTSDEPDSTGGKASGSNHDMYSGNPVSPNLVGSDSNLRGSSSQVADHYAQPVAPLAAYFSPQIVASPSTNEDQTAATTATTPDDPSPVQEIYIGRRPSIVKLLQQQQQQQRQANLYSQASQMMAPMSQAGSAQVWRGSPGPHSSGMEHDLPQQQQQLPEDAANSDYMMRAPPMAASYAHQSAGGQQSEEDQPQTVTYGLSFGGASSLDSGSGGGDGGDDGPPQPDDHQGSTNYEEEQQQQPGGGYMPYNERDLLRYKTSSSSNYNQQRAGGRSGGPAQQVGYVGQPVPGSYVMQQPYHGAKYHKDPSEMGGHQGMAPMGPRYNQMAGHYRRPQQQQQQQRQYRDPDDRAAATMERQQLLATLDKQIRASPYYRSSNNAHGQHISRRPDHSASSQMVAAAATDGGPTSRDAGRLLATSDLDTFDSYHSEVDPYRTYTATSRMIKYPSGGHLDESGAAAARMLATSAQTISAKQDAHRDATTSNLATGPLVNYDHNHSSNQQHRQQQQQQQVAQGDDLLRTGHLLNAADGGGGGGGDSAPGVSPSEASHGRNHLRVRRDDSEDRSDDVDDDDGVWVDDDEDDDNRQQSSDVNETAQDPDSDEADGGAGDDDASGAQDEQDGAYNNNRATQLSPPGLGAVGAPHHGYELSPNDLMIYPGRRR